MTAQEARDLTKLCLAVPVIQDLVEEVDQKIQKASTQGRFCIRNPFLNLKRHLHEGEFKALEDHYRENGYRIMEHPAPEQYNPISKPYTTLSWSE